MNPPNRFERQAADRLLTRAITTAIHNIRGGHDPRPLLAVAGAGAALLLGETV